MKGLRRTLLLIFILGASRSLAVAESCDRIVSLAPSITETLFEIGLGKNIVGVTRFDKYPPEVSSIPRIGGFLDPNLEVLLGLHPTIVIGLKEQEDVLRRVSWLGMKTSAVEHRSIDGILTSFGEIGSLCAMSDRAGIVKTSLERRMNEIDRRLKGATKVSVIVVVGRDEGTEGIRGLFVSGNDGYYSSLLERAGGENLNKGKTAGFSSFSREGLIAINPQVIIEIISEAESNGRPVSYYVDSWKSMPYLRAVQENRVYVFGDDFASIPGPRFILLLEKLAKTLHPESYLQ